MKLETAQLLMNRCLDGVATIEEREQLARALKGDPLLHAEFEELESAHASTESLFRQLKLPEDFSARIMRRVQQSDVPSDENLEAVRLPAQRRLGARPRRVLTHRKRARVYAVIATFSAAAAVMLAIGVLSGFFARAGIGTQGATPVNPIDKNLAEGGQGGPDREELNRTDSSTPSPSKTSGSVEDAPKRPDPDENPAPEPREVRREQPSPEVVEESDPVESAPPKAPEPEVQPKRDDVVEAENPASGSPRPDEPKETVEEKVEEPHARKTEALPAERERVGHLFIMNGKAELVDATGAGKPVGEEQDLFVGDRIRTNVNGLVLLQTENGDLTIHYRSEVTLTSRELVNLESGTVAMDRNNTHVGTDMGVKADGYTIYLNEGCTVIERKRRGLVIQKPFGFASISHDEFGTALLDAQSGHEVDVDFGKPVEDVRAKSVRMTDWAAESRAKALLLAVGDAITHREYPARELSYVEDRLPSRVEKLTRYPVGQDAFVEFFNQTLGNKQLEGGALILMVTELEAAYIEVTELTPEVITGHAGRASLVAENFDQWKDYFYRLMRPPVEPKPDCPLEKKKKVVKVPPEPEEGRTPN